MSADDSRAGFTAFQFATFPEFAELFQSYVDWQHDAPGELAGHGRNILTVEIAESCTARLMWMRGDVSAREPEFHPDVTAAGGS